VLLSVVIGSVNITMLAPYSIEFTRAATSAALLFKLIDRQSAIDPFDKSGEQPSEINGLVELENVSFAYPTRPGVPVLDNFSLRVPAGKVTALVVSRSVYLPEHVRWRLTQISTGPKRFRQEYHRRPH
jgi:ATP-binding cassette subfamily B (MDR/TAP) protein 1